VRSWTMHKKIILVSRCAWTLYNFRSGLMRALKHKGATVIGGGSGGDGFEPQIEALGVPFTPLPVAKKAINPPADVHLLYTLYRWYRRERPQVVHHFTIKPVIYGSLAARLAGVPRVVNTVTGLGFVFTEERMAWLRRPVEWQYRLALACAHFTFFQNPDDLEFFRVHRLVKARNSGLLPGSGVDCQLFTPGALTNPPPKERLTFLMVARLLREKGVYEFVEAARRVKSDFPETQFQLLGKRDERNPTVVSRVDLNRWQAEGIVTWMGQVADVRPIVAKADVVVLPSYREGTPRSLLEAAAMGKPLITTDTVGCREVVDDGVNGVLVPVKDSEVLAQAMVHLIDHPEVRECMGNAGREKMEREFDERMVIEKTLRVYQQGSL
jgi:glycosyltransferase involved in cell wall biosynthesis